MRTPPIVAGRLAFTEDGTPRSPSFDDVYHTRAGALPQARHVFLGGNGLPDRWSGRRQFTILETGFGLGNNFLASWAAWRDDPDRCEVLHYLSVEQHPLSAADLQRAHTDHEFDALASTLVASWPPLTPDLHRIDFEGGRVQLHLAFGDARHWLPAWDARVDAFYLDGFAPGRNPELWDARLIRQLARLAVPGATASTWSAAGSVREALRAAQFEVHKAPGFGGKRDMTVARYQPRASTRPSRAKAGLRAPAHAMQAIVIGAGLAGTAVAWALRQQGWSSTVVDVHGAPAGAASGNLAGLFHGIVHTAENPHTRWHRAATLRMAAVARPWIESGQIAGSIEGLLRLDDRIDDAHAAGRLESLGLPSTFVQWWPQARVKAASGVLQPPSGGWFFPEAGWVCPADVCRQLLLDSGATFIGGSRVIAIEPTPDGWTVRLDDGRSLTAGSVIVAAADHSAGLLETWLPAGWMSRIRGQTSVLPASGSGPAKPTLPLAGAGYAIGLPDGRLLCGATTQHDDDDPSVRAVDHEHNLAQWRRLSGQDAPVDPRRLSGRTGWRASTRDRLPVVGPVPTQPFASPGTPLRQRTRMYADNGGLFVLAGLGSRGLGSGVLAAEVLASWVTGSPCPVPTDLRDAIDVARLFDAAPVGTSSDA